MAELPYETTELLTGRNTPRRCAPPRSSGDFWRAYLIPRLSGVPDLSALALAKVEGRGVFGWEDPHP
jgi:hypothetical protein